MHSKAALTVLASIAASGALALPAPVPRSHGLQARADAAQNGKSEAATKNWVGTTDYENPAHNPYPQENGDAAKPPGDKYSYYYPPHGGSDSSRVSPNTFLPVTANPKNPEDQHLPGHGPTYGNRVPLYNTAHPQDNACENGCGGDACPCPLYITPSYQEPNNHNTNNIPSVPQGAGLGPGGPLTQSNSQPARRDDNCGYAGDKFCDRPSTGMNPGSGFGGFEDSGDFEDSGY
ncbi:Hypothetical predicted protein [Lecanosticta acicola]|uniref:Uncharacterized protein n=1 Tax=Lecanosticta acicola TaxID=111012 RepID=A0AAI8Z3I4_9PEZI|nr:Hypothetical predicted protein [Lecanosticta acicola]